jgi:hypothetical protein
MAQRAMVYENTNPVTIEVQINKRVSEVASAYYGQFLSMAGSGSVRISVVSQFEISALGGKWTSGYWSHRQCDAQIVPDLTSEQRRLKLF